MDSQKQFALRINCGSDEDYTDTQGRKWVPDIGFGSGPVVNHGPIDIARTTDSTKYRTERQGGGPGVYNIEIPNGTYYVIFHFAENNMRVTWPKHRLFDIYVQGERIPDIDIFGDTGGWSRAMTRKIRVSVTNSSMWITYTHNAWFPAVVNGIEILSDDYEQPGIPVVSPKQLLAVNGDGITLLKWSTAQGADCYNIKRKSSGEYEFAAIANGIFGNKYVDRNLTNGQKYEYAVSAVYQGVESENSPETDACPQKAELQPYGHLPENIELGVGQGINMKFVLIPPGQFVMGSPAWEKGRVRDEEQHMVTITKPFYMGIYEVTQEQYEAVMGYNPSHPINLGKKKPVDTIRQSEAVEFCRKLSGITGRKLRLPTEAEFEYAARGGSSDAFFFGNDGGMLKEYCWGLHDRRISHEVGLLKPNPFGLYDIIGNVWEWVSDWYKYEYENDEINGIDPVGPDNTGLLICRGGCSFNGPELQRCAARHMQDPRYRDNALGMRVVMEA